MFCVVQLCNSEDAYQIQLEYVRFSCVVEKLERVTASPPTAHLFPPSAFQSVICYHSVTNCRIVVYEDWWSCYMQMNRRRKTERYVLKRYINQGVNTELFEKTFCTPGKMCWKILYPNIK